MKTRRLSEIDLARFCTQNGENLERALQGYNTGGGAWSYDPVRASTSDLLAASTPLVGTLQPIPWTKLKAQIAGACRRGEAQVKANLEVGEVLFQAARALEWSAAKFSMGYLPIGFGETVRFWSDVVLEDQDDLFIPFFDHRRQHGVSNPQIAQIVFSMQHLWVRDRHPDLAETRLAIVRFPDTEGERAIDVTFHVEADLLAYEELDRRVRAVYEAWARVSAEKVHQQRRRTGTGGNPFDF